MHFPDLLQELMDSEVSATVKSSMHLKSLALVLIAITIPHNEKYETIAILIRKTLNSNSFYCLKSQLSYIILSKSSLQDTKVFKFSNVLKFFLYLMLKKKTLKTFKYFPNLT